MDFSTGLLDMLPKGAIYQPTIDKARQILHPAIFNHSLRVYFHAVNLIFVEGQQQGFQAPTFFPTRAIDRDLLFVAALFHDVGTTSLYNGRQRFEVEGADAACAHLAAHGCDAEADHHRVWSAIALHTSPGIAERIDPFTRILRTAVKIDFSSAVREKFGATDFATEIEKDLPRLDIESVLADAVVAQAGKILNEQVKIDVKTWPDSEKHPKASWPGILLRAHLEDPSFEGVNPAF